MPAGYSKTPLARKLGIKEGYSLLLFQQPDYYLDLFADMPQPIEILEKGIEGEINFIHLFLTTQQELEANFNTYKNYLRKDGLMWISWPKGKSGIKTDLKRDLIREYGLANGLVDVKVAALDEKWSGLKFVYRLKDR